MTVIPICLAVEDVLSEGVLRKLLSQSRNQFAVGQVFSRGGNGYLRSKVLAWNQAAAHLPILLLTDLDNVNCPSQLKSQWLPNSCHSNLLFRVAVREVESWLLADASNMAQFLGCLERVIPQAPESIENPKQHLIDLARSAKSKATKERLVPRPHSTATQGPDYNSCLLEFVQNKWDPIKAAKRAQSLAKTMERIDAFSPSWAS